MNYISMIVATLTVLVHPNGNEELPNCVGSPAAESEIADRGRDSDALREYLKSKKREDIERQTQDDRY